MPQERKTCRFSKRKRTQGRKRRTRRSRLQPYHGGALEHKQLKEYNDEIETYVEDNSTTKEEGWKLFDRIFPILKKEYPDNLDLMYMTEAVENKEKRRSPLPPLRTLLRVLEKYIV